MTRSRKPCMVKAQSNVGIERGFAAPEVDEVTTCPMRRSDKKGFIQTVVDTQGKEGVTLEI